MMNLKLVLQIIGTLLNASAAILTVHKKRIAWLVWIGSSLVWSCVFIMAELYVALLTSVMYLGFNIWGWVYWGKNPFEGKDGS